jgi:Flp pilus assembly protein TadD
MRKQLHATLAALVLSVAALAGQTPAPVDTSKIGPQVGATVPAFSGTDQFGKTHTLASSYGPKGTMLVFFRSSDW